MVIAAFPQPDQTPPPTLTYAQLKQERDQAIGRVKHLEEKLTKAVELEGRVFELEEWKRSTTELLATPNDVLSPAQRIAIVSLRLYKEQKEEQGKTGHQVFKTRIFSEQIGLGDEGSRKILHHLHDAGAIDLRVHEEWVDKKKKMWSTVECLPQLETAPATWGIGRDPNGKQCECNAGTLTTVAQHEQVATFTRVSTRCAKCNRTHRTKVYNRTVRSDRLTSEVLEFQTEAEAMALVDAEKSGQSLERTGDVLDQDMTFTALPLPCFSPTSGSDVNQGENYIEQPEDEPEAPDRGVPWSKGTPPEVLEPSTSIETLLLAIAGPDSQHLELLPTGEAKCIVHKGPVTLELVQRMMAGNYSPGTRLGYPNGMTRALCLDADTLENKQTLIDAASKLDSAGASPLLESSPSIHHPDNVHLWIIFDELVNAAAAWATIEAIVPELKDWPERWPGTGKRVRLPGAYYRRPGAAAWCQLWRPGGMHVSSDRAWALMLKEQTPACWVTASPPPVPEPVRRSTPARSTSSRWIPPTRPIQQGEQDTSLAPYAMAMAGKGMSEGDIFTELRRIVDELCEQIPGDPILDSSLWAKARSAVKKARGSYDG